MGKISFVFSGQGAQAPGMGKALYEASPQARAVFDMAEAIRPGTLAQCFEGTAEELSQTINTQPCVFCVDLAAAAALAGQGIQPDYVAGFSLGEIAALTFAGVFTPEQGFRFVCERAKAMDRAAAENPGAMVAVLKLQDSQVQEICSGFSQVWPVNYNCPGQVAVAGSREEIEKFSQAVKEAGGKAVPLAVSGGFHSPFMESASQELAGLLEGEALGTPRIPVYANYTAAPYGENGKELIAAQVKSPVRWWETVNALWEQGTDAFLECGPGKTLCGLIKKTQREARVLNIEGPDALEAAKALIS